MHVSESSMVRMAMRWRWNLGGGLLRDLGRTQQQHPRGVNRRHHHRKDRHGNHDFNERERPAPGI